MAHFGSTTHLQQQHNAAAARTRCRAPAAYAAANARRPLTVTAAIKSKSKRQVCCSKTLIARPEAVDEVQRLCADVTAFSQQRMDDRTSGLHAFDCVKDQWEVRLDYDLAHMASCMGRHAHVIATSRGGEQQPVSEI